jgi:signal transduction histidine kinase
MWTVIVSAPGGSERRHLSEGGSLTVGRDRTNDIVVVRDGVSRQHARLRCTERGVSVTDLGSRFGTRVNGDSIHGERLLGAGDVVDIGVELRVERPELHSSESSIYTTVSETSVASNRLVRQMEGEAPSDCPDLVSALFEMTRRLSDAPSRDAYLLDLVRFAARMSGFQQGIALEKSPSGTFGPLAGNASAPVRFSNSVVREAASKGSALLVNHLRSDARFSSKDSVVLGDTVTVLCVPFALRGEVFGAIYLAHPGHLSPSARTLEVITALGYLGAVAIERARLRRDAQVAADARARRLEAVGRLAGGVAHEINTPLQCLSSNLAFVRAELTEGVGGTGSKELLESIEESLRCCVRVAAIVKALKEYAQPDFASCVPTELHGVLKKAIDQARPEFEPVAMLETDFGNPVEVYGSPAELGECFLNLLCNAGQAIAETKRDARGTIRVSSHVEGADVVVQISDDGVGIPEDLRHKVWEPFFTTRSIGEGTGLGLTLARAAVRGHGGSISFESAKGLGTTFTIRLPLKAGPSGIRARPVTR